MTSQLQLAQLFIEYAAARRAAAGIDPIESPAANARQQRPAVVTKPLCAPVCKFSRRGVGNLTGRRPLAPSATDAMPGTEEKIAVLAARAAAGLDLWHPDDAGSVLRMAPAKVSVAERILRTPVNRYAVMR